MSQSYSQMIIYIKQIRSSNGEWLHHEVLQELLRQQIKGATLIHAEAGFGQSRHLQMPNLLGSLDSQPMIIFACDTQEKIAQIRPWVRSKLQGGAVVVFPVEVDF